MPATATIVTGWMVEQPDHVSLAFADYASGLVTESLDIGTRWATDREHAGLIAEKPQ